MGGVTWSPTATTGGQAINSWHDAPSSTGTGVYTISNTLEWFSDCGDHRSLPDTENRVVNRPSISGLDGVWWLGGGSDPANGYYNQAALTGNTNCSYDDNCSDAPYWSVLGASNKVTLDCSVCTTNTITGQQASDSKGDIAITFNIGGFYADALLFTVNAPYRLVPSDPCCVDDPYDDGYISYVYYYTYDKFDELMPSIALNEQFGAFADDQPNNWNKPPAVGLSGYAGSAWYDQIYHHLCSSCTPPVLPPQTPLGSSALDHASQEWRVGSATIGTGVRVQTDTFQRYTDHGRHYDIVSPAP